jgi:hypothetical protein
MDFFYGANGKANAVGVIFTKNKNLQDDVPHPMLALAATAVCIFI